MKKESEYPKWRRIFSATADAQGFADVLDAKKDRTKMTASEIDLDDVQNKAMYPVFQQTLLTPETSAIVLELEKAEEKSRKIWKDVDDLFKKSIYHKNNK